MTNFSKMLEYTNQLSLALKNVPEELVNKFIKILLEAINKGATIAVCGNGGSASTSEHFVCDLLRPRKMHEICYRVFALGRNVALLSANSNDIDYSVVFEQETRTLLRRGDVLICLSCSGMSSNIIKAVSAAAEIGVRVLALTGQSGGLLAKSDFVEALIAVSSDNVSHIEDAHHAICHYISGTISEILAAGTL